MTSYRTVWKQELMLLDVQEIVVPEGAELLSVHEQYGGLCIWYRCDPNVVYTVKRKIAICGTGNPCPEDGRFIGTVVTHGGALVWHVFERTE